MCMSPMRKRAAKRPGFVIKKDVGLDTALALIQAASKEAARLGLAISAAVVDSSGQLVASLRMDGAQLCAMPLAIDKAFTAVACGLPTAAWAERTRPWAIRR